MAFSMNTIYLLCNNLLDSSRIKESLIGKNVIILRNLDKLKSIEVLENDTVLIDYHFYENGNIKDLLDLTSNCKNIISFVPHEKIDALKSENLNVFFVARSVFFKNILKYIVI